MEEKMFDWIEYIVFSFTLALSTVIGVFFCCSKGGQHTVSEYYLGDKKMTVFPIAMSLIASTISGITLLGQPSEIYFHGAQFALANVANVLICLINIFIYLPVFYNLQIVSLYEYLELRFDRKVRILASILFTVSWTLFLPVVIYGPALVFNRVSGLSIHVVSPILCVVCIFYTTVGGLKAVVWSDVLQGTVMICSLVVVVALSLAKVGGLHTIFSTAYENGRLNVFDMDPDPTKRITFWSSTIGLTFLWLAFSASNPVMVQRFISLPSLKQAKMSAMYQCIGICTFSLLSIFLGLIIFSYYQHCDPLTSKMIIREDQILPHFVLDVAGHIKGLPGLFVAGMVCTALSTMSTGLNTLAGTFYEDFVEPVIGKKSERTASNCMKIISIVLGIICTALVTLIERMGNIIDLSSKFDGVTSGAILGIFTLGLLIPQANSQGAFYGGIVAAIFMSWTMIGHELSPEHKYECATMKSISIEGCANKDNITLVNRTCEMASDTFKMAFPTSDITVFYYGIMGLMLSMLFGIIISYATGFTDPAKLNPELISPVIRKYLPNHKRKYDSVPLKGKVEKNDNGSHTYKL